MSPPLLSDSAQPITSLLRFDEMTPKTEKVFRKYMEDLKNYTIISFILITVLLLGGSALAIFLHGMQTLYIIFPLMWVVMLVAYLAKIPFFVRASKDFRDKKTAKAKINAPELVFDGKSCLKVQKGAIIGSPKYTVKDDDGRTYFLYITAEGTDVKDKISFEDGSFEVTYLANCGIILSVKAVFCGDDEDKDDFHYRVNKFLGDYIE